MQLPEKIPGLRLFTALVAVYAVAWIGLEGELGRVALLAVLLMLLGAGHVAQRIWAGRRTVLWRLSLAAAVGGLLSGWSCAWLALSLMAVKTGLHGHGPEFSPDQIMWVANQAPLWGFAGSLASLGIVLIASAVTGER